jgi:hypothetical protein
MMAVPAASRRNNRMILPSNEVRDLEILEGVPKVIL